MNGWSADTWTKIDSIVNQTKPDLQVIFNNNQTCPQFAGGYNTTDEYGNLVMVDNCECERRKVISDPTIGYGEFNIRSGLFLDEKLQVPLPVDQEPPYRTDFG